ncbi:uncharacterized protein V6R79_005003 [Siganus canaliculatus]
MEVAALGRPFSLGMLYDCRNESLIPGMTLWDQKDLTKNVQEQLQNYNDFSIVASESFEHKASALNVEASLKASFLSGLVDVEGSAKYLKDQKTSKNQARVTLTYKTTTKVLQLSMNHLGRGNVKHPYVFDNGLATHVVTAILYGAQAFFVFDSEKSETEEHMDVEGNLKVVMKKIPLMSIEGKGSLNLSNKEKESVDKFSCKFYGDFCLEKTPTSFQDAVQVYQSLPTLLGPNGEKAVPMKVWLLPLTSLDSSAAKLVRQISSHLVQEAQGVLEDFTELEMRCNDALKTTTVKQFPQIGKKMKTFKEMCSSFRLDFQQNLAKILPSIRGGGPEEAVIAEILKKRHSSPFNSKDLNEWMECKEKEIYIIKTFTNMMKNTKTVGSHTDLYKEISSGEQAVCFVFTSLGGQEPYLSTLNKYLNKTLKPDEPPVSHNVEEEQWYSSTGVAEAVHSKAKLFSDFAEANKENKNIKFLMIGLTDETLKGSSIYFYSNPFTIKKNYEPPSKPRAVTVRDQSHHSVTLEICPPEFGVENITSYSAEYCVSGEDEWQQQAAERPGEVTVTGLKPNTDYKFRCRAVTSVGVGPVCEVSSSIRTLPCSPPRDLRVIPNPNSLSVSWERPAELGLDVRIVGYIVEFTRVTSGVRQEELQWDQMMSSSEEATISGLETDTEYVVRVECDCGEAGRSKKSITVNTCTTRVIEVLQSISTTPLNQPECLPVYMLPLKNEKNNAKGCRVFSFQKESCKTKQSRTIMLLGATGAGKSTLINGMINYILGVKWKDEYRIKLVHEDPSKSQTSSQTTEVTVYKLNHQEGFQIEYSLTIIDTPGFGDTGGIEKDKQITEQLRNLFSSDLGIDEIDAVYFVVQAPLVRLTPSQKYVFDSVLSIFGKDVEENIQILVTFADGKRPPVIDAIRDSGVPCPKNKAGLPVHFKFNNSVLFSDNKTSGADSSDVDEEDDDGGGFDEMFWNMGTQSMKKFFSALSCMKTKSLTLTKEVLRERQQLENLVEHLQKQVQMELAKMVEIILNNRKYQVATEGKKTFETLLDKMIEEYEQVQLEAVRLMERSSQSLNRLKEIALKPNPLSAPEYIDLLIETEKCEGKPGWKKRVKSLMAMRQKAEVMAKVGRGEKPLAK